MTKVCSQIDELLMDFSNLVQVRNLQATLTDALRNYQHNIGQTKGLLSDNSVELQKIQGFYEAQEVRKRLSGDKIEQHVIEATSYFNKQVSEELSCVKT